MHANFSSRPRFASTCVRNELKTGRKGGRQNVKQKKKEKGEKGKWFSGRNKSAEPNGGETRTALFRIRRAVGSGLDALENRRRSETYNVLFAFSGSWNSAAFEIQLTLFVSSPRLGEIKKKEKPVRVVSGTKRSGVVPSRSSERER